MAEAMHRLNVTILDEDDQITHWRGSPSVSGGALKKINVSPVSGPPMYDYDTTGNDREQLTFEVDTVILGATAVEQKAFIAKYARGKIFPNANISGLPEGKDWIVENALPKHNADGEDPSMLSITLAEMGPHRAGGGGA